MNLPLLFSNHAQTIFIFDIPLSIAVGNGGGRILTIKPVQTPHVTPEPKGNSRKVYIAGLPPWYVEYHDKVQAGIESALKDISCNPGEHAVWCAPREENKDVTGLFTYSRLGSDLNVSNYIPVILSPLQNDFATQFQLHDQLVLNPFAVPTTIQLSSGTNRILVPANCGFLWTSMEGAVEILKAQGGRKARRQFDIVLMDPPWPNKSVSRGRKYATSESQDSKPFLTALDIARLHVKYTGFMAIWITNKAAIQLQVTSYMNLHGFSLQEEWIWVKVTSQGQPITPLDGVWRRPYEILLVFREYAATEAVPCESLRRYVFAVPDVHSRKPNLAVLFSRLLKSTCVLELFARNLTAGWWSIGDEVLKFQNRESWHQWPCD